MTFETEKRGVLSRPDKSSKGSIDIQIKPLLDIINKKKEYYTTSSCAGRVVLLKDAPKKRAGAFVFASHDPVRFSQIKKAISSVQKTKETIYLKHEQAILHVSCKTVDDAMELITIARNCGWKRSGMISRNGIIELISTEQLEAPVISKGKVIVDDSYLKVLVNEANSKLARTRKKIERLLGELKKN